MTNNSSESNKNSDSAFNKNMTTTDTPRIDSVMVPTLHNLRVNLIFRIESAIDNDESLQIKRTDSIGNFLERDAPECLLAEAFLANHYPELLKK